ncbi:MAG TPA: CheB methylesterase domain-containing protein, partial [Gemmatimonadaceae bacterium]|nr:CheB methylesterase domain-containing protein [Gemmatimonadaceae bacterium]
LAEWLNTSCNLRVKIAHAAEPLRPHTVYIAPDQQHLGVTAGLRVALSTDEAIGGFRPSGTYLFESAAKACGSATVAVALTGMGVDGVSGLRTLRAAGGRVIAQDEQSSVVWGIPGEAVRAGLVDAVLGIDTIGKHLRDIVTGGVDGGSRSSR